MGSSLNQPIQLLCAFVQMKKAKTEEERETLCLRSLEYLERYIYMIVFNAYLHSERQQRWKKPFAAWMKQVMADCKVVFVYSNQSVYVISHVMSS